MDTVRDRIGDTREPDDGAVQDAVFEVGGDERRMHVRAYNHWVSLLKGRPYPAIADLDPDSIVDFGPHSVLLDFTQGGDDPGITYLGRVLRAECGLEQSLGRISDVPGRSLLSRLTDHYLQIIANRAPIGFEAEFKNIRDRTTLYRGILMPFSSDGETIDFIYGVINWKEVVDRDTQATLDAELDAAMRNTPKLAASAPVWADGPSTDFADDIVATSDPEPAFAPAGSLGDQLAMARESAAAVRAADTRSRAALYRALGRAHDFALAAVEDTQSYALLLDHAGIAVQARAPMTPIAKLVFGVDYDKTRLTEFAAVLQHAQRHHVREGKLGAFLDSFEGGIKGVVAAERLARKPAKTARAMPSFGDRAVLAEIDFATKASPGEAVVLVGRVGAHGRIEIVGSVERDGGLIARAVQALTQ
jgi:hypothetical protein